MLKLRAKTQGSLYMVMSTFQLCVLHLIVMAVLTVSASVSTATYDQMKQ
jgi:hypothetical protein